MGASMKRTQKDEDDYNLELRLEEPIKTEVIVELRRQNAGLWASQAKLLKALLAAEEALRLYREGALAYAEQAANDTSHCTPGCKAHYWDSVDGWHRKGEK